MTIFLFQLKKAGSDYTWSKSGAGKSTILNILGGMDTPDEGQIIIDEHRNVRNFQINGLLLTGEQM